ncbi:10483_t:CDS:1, partial [Scutellospora calospora]
KENIFDSNWDNQQKTKNYSTWSINNKEEFFETPLLIIDHEEQLFEEIKICEYILFTSYEKFKNYLIKEKIINLSLKIYENTKNKRLNSLLSWIEFHIRSTFYG